MGSKIKRIVRLVIVAYLLTVLMLTFFETWLVYPAPQADVGDWIAADYPHEQVDFASADGTKLHGWLFEHPSPQHVVLYFHGNGEHVAHNAQLMDYLRSQLKATVFIFDYRGYGKSEGRPHESGVVDDGLAAQRWLAQRAKVETNQIVLIGRSLGGAVATASAARLGAKSLVLQNTFARMVDTAAQLYPWLPVRLVMRNRYDSVARLQQYDGPLLQSHAKSDQIIPITQARQLFDASKSENKQWYEFSGDHNSGQPVAYYPLLQKFLEQSGPPAE